MTTVIEPGTERMLFFPRQLIGADDLNRAQDYHRQKLREHNRMLHGWGVVCGCGVRAEPTTERPWQVRIEPGYLVTPHGDTVSIRADVLLDLATCAVDSTDQCAFARPCPPITRRRLDASRTVYVAVRYTECESRPVRVAAPGCSCGDDECQYSRVVEAFEVGCLEKLPGTHQATTRECDEVLAQRTLPCAPCPEDDWVVLATITLPERESTRVKNVDPILHRQLLPSAGALQEMVRCLMAR
jgi:hypothetical protein